MKKILFVIALTMYAIGHSQDIVMQNGTFNRCAPDKFYDSGGDFGNYANDENLVTTICPQNAGDFIVLDFLAFSTQQGINGDTMNIYDGDDTSAPLLGSYQGTLNTFTVSATETTNTSGCLTIEFISGASGNSTGWDANILCAQPCQDIMASIDATVPAANNLGTIDILPGTTVDFTGSATFSDSGANATYQWSFGEGSTASGLNVSNTYNTVGSYQVTFTVTDDNPNGCENVATIFVNVLEPIVSVNNPAYAESSWTLPELIENTFIEGGDCAVVDTFSFQVNGAPTDLTSKSYGYFTRGGAANFPFESGIILTTGVAAQAGNMVNPTLVSNNNGQAGDLDLQTALNQNNTNDATFVKFNFMTPADIDEITFDYIMASEEYDGSTECSFADSFAFLLREVGTAAYTNIAVLPDGTPVSVTNINNSANCNSNPQFFAGYNIGETNYGGRTNVLTATLNVQPNVEYEFKLVVADQGDSIWDSAIFLDAGSFNLGGDLGDDITIAAGTAECGGDAITLDTQATTATHTWYYAPNFDDDINVATVIPDETGSTLDVTAGGRYFVNVEFTAGCETSADIFVEFRPSPTANSAQDLSVCDADGTAEFDLSENDDDVLGSQDPNEFVISYHLSEEDAMDNVGALPTTYTNTSNPQPIWVRIADVSQECYDLTSFQLLFSDITIDGAISDLSVCDDDNDGFTAFTLTDRDAEVIGTNTNVSVTYHLTQDDADDNVMPLASPYTNVDPNNQTIVARLQDVNVPDCYATAQVNLVAIPSPIATMPTAFELCDDNADGLVEFDLSLKNPEIIGAQTGVTVTYHLNENDAMMGMSALPNLYTNASAGAQIIHVRVESDSANCYALTTLQLIVNSLPTTVAVSDFELCDYDNPGDEQEQFDLATKTNEILNGQVNTSVTYYPSQADAIANTNAITALYTNTSNPQEIVAVLTNTNTSCTSQVTFNLVVDPLPSLVVPTDLEVCDDGVPDGLTEIDLSLKNVEISGNNPNYSVTYYFDLNDAELEQNPLTIPYTNISNPQTIGVRVEDTNTGCYDTTTLTLVVEQAPAANTPDALRYCDPDNDGFGVFDLTQANNAITGGVAGLSVTYHETEVNAENNVDAIDTTELYSNISEDMQTLYARVESATIATNCATIVELVLIVEETPQLQDPEPLEECDDVSADGFASFDLTEVADEVLNGSDPLQYLLSYYESEANAEDANNPIANPNAYTNTQANSQVIWIRVDDTATVNGCYKLVSLELIVNPLPVLVQPMPLELCDAITLDDEQEGFTLEDANAEILNGQTGITLTYYTSLQDAQDAMNPIVSPYINTANPETLYVRGENDITGCYSTVLLTLRVNPIPSPEESPDPIEVCDDDNDGYAEFNLEERTVEITNGELDVVITYHETEADAENGENALVSPYTNIVEDIQDIYVRSENTLTGCYSLTDNTLELRVIESPEVPTSIEPLVVCDDNPDGLTQFDLTQHEADILGIQDADLTYHVTAADAQTGDNPIINVGNYTNTSNPQTIYVRLYNPTTECLDTGEFELQVQLPPVAVQPTPLELCDDLGEIPGNQVTVFDLTEKDSEITNGNASWSVAYYETDADAQAQANAIADPTQYTNTSVGGLAQNPQTLHVVVTDTDTGCVDYVTLTIRVLPNPTPTQDLPALELCDEVNTGDAVEVFNLLGLEGNNEQQILIINGEEGVTATYHETPEDAYAGENAIADPTQYSNTSAEQTIYVRVTNDVTGCYSLVNFVIRVNALPAVVAVTDFIQCELFTDEIDEFDLTTKDDEVLNGQDPMRYVVSYHETLVDAEAGMNGLVSPYTNTSNPQTIYVTITDTVTGCSISTQSFNLQVDEAAQANPDMGDITYELCDDNMETDGDTTNDTVQFTLSSQDEFVLDGQDPTNYIVSYYASEVDANQAVNQLPDTYENTVNPQVIYARVDNNTLEVTPIALDLTALTASLDLNGDGTDDIYDTDTDMVFDLVDVDGDGVSDVLATDASGFITAIDIDGDGQADAVDLNNDGSLDNQIDTSVCFAVAEVTLQVNPLPMFSFEDQYVLCLNTNGTEAIEPLVLDTELSATDYTFEWTLNDDVIAGETSPSLVPTQGGVYGVTVTDVSTSTETMCPNYQETTVIESAPPAVDYNILTQHFGETNVVEAIATGISTDHDFGGYEYSLDGGPWQDSGIFDNVSRGLHEITARDIIGCGSTTIEVFMVDYPRFFTPNGDEENETWHVEGLESDSKIYIFDRYGKLLKQLSPDGQGWDGTYNGNKMPTGGYWFLLEYTEPLNGQRKEFKAHFTLKR